MSRALGHYLLVDRQFYDTLDRYELKPDFVGLARDLMPDSWALGRDHVWVKALPPEEVRVPKQGFKIHISALPTTAEQIVRIAVPLCVREKVSFKFVGDPELLAVTSSKSYGRASSGKFFVIYPQDTEQFKHLLEVLHQETQGLKGPYILSDRSYDSSEVLFYRYGGFVPSSRIRPNGERVPQLSAPNGDRWDDERTPYFTLPPWVRDPFPPPPNEDDEDGPLNGRYEVFESLSFSNSGGVYLAKDLETGDDVVIKEARPLTNIFRRGDDSLLDATDLLRNEYDALRTLQDLDAVVTPIELFQEWKHLFLVEERVAGISLLNYRAREDFHLFPCTFDAERLRRFCTKFRRIALNLLAAIDAIHAKGVVLGDISPANILIVPETLEVCFIDLESAVHSESEEAVERLSALWSTPGFRATSEQSERRVGFAGDLFALSRVLLNLFATSTPMLDLEPAAEQRCFEKIHRATRMPDAIPLLLAALQEGDSPGALEILEAWDVESSIAQSLADDRPEPRWRRTSRELEETIERLGQHILSTTSPKRRDRLWPGDPLQFRQGGLCVAYGACGVALFLQTMHGELPEDAVQWLLQHRVDPNVQPHGLYLGLAGIAYTFDQLGFTPEAREVLEQSLRSPLFGRDASLVQGDAGWGWVQLYFHRRYGSERELERAVRIGDLLLQSSTVDDGLRWWPQSDGKINFGLAYGASGVAMFLAQLAHASNDGRFATAALQCLRFERSNGIDRPSGGLSWGRHSEDSTAMPYWEHGAAGVGTAALRVHQALGDEESLALARAAAREAFTRFTVNLEQFSGLAGIGELMLDMAIQTGEASYLDQAHDIADSILRHRVTRPEGYAFPGRRLLRLSHDYGTGGAGIGLFLHRLLEQTPRLLHDLDATCGSRTTRVGPPRMDAETVIAAE
ncbi:MAG: class III lanthionine synthetase LanKC [Acidobacteriota bacterium]